MVHQFFGHPVFILVVPRQSTLGGLRLGLSIGWSSPVEYILGQTVKTRSTSGDSKQTARSTTHEHFSWTASMLALGAVCDAAYRIYAGPHRPQVDNAKCQPSAMHLLSDRRSVLQHLCQDGRATRCGVCWRRYWCRCAHLRRGNRSARYTRDFELPLPTPSCTWHRSGLHPWSDRKLECCGLCFCGLPRRLLRYFHRHARNKHVSFNKRQIRSCCKVCAMVSRKETMT